MFFFGFGSLFYTIVLLLNAIVILSDDRFLARIGALPSSYDPSFGQGADQSVWGKLINMVASVKMLMRFPLIIVNTLIIMYELVLG